MIRSNGPVCAGAPLTLSATGVPAGSTYLWRGPSGFSSAQPTVEVTADTTLRGPFTLTINSSCPVTSAPLPVLVYARPLTPRISQRGGTLSSSAASGNQWYLNGQPLAGATARTYEPTVVGAYSVVVTNGANCASEASAPAAVAVVLATHLAAPDTSLQVYPIPAPAGGAVQVTLHGYRQGATLRLLGELGRVVRQHTVAPAGTSRTQLEVRDLPAGLYLLQALSSKGLATRRLVLE